MVKAELVTGMIPSTLFEKIKPKGKKVTYARFCCDERPQKEESDRCRITVEGDRLDCNGETSTEVSSMETTKIHINSTISTKGATYACADVGNFYTNSRLTSPEYMRIHERDITQEVKDEYNVMDYVDDDGYVYCEITGAMYGLKAAGYIANQDLKKHLAPHGYYPSKRTPGLWLHKTRPISFTLVVDDFGVKYMNKKDINHLFDIQRKVPSKNRLERKQVSGNRFRMAL